MWHELYTLQDRRPRDLNYSGFVVIKGNAFCGENSDVISAMWLMCALQGACTLAKYCKNEDVRRMGKREGDYFKLC